MMKTLKRVRMKVLEPFARNLDGQIVTGHPKHPDEEGRFIFVSEASADTLEDAGLAKRFSYKDEARAEIEGEEAEFEHEEDEHDAETGEITNRPVVDEEGTSTQGAASGAKSATEVRREKVSTGANSKAGNGARRRKARSGSAPKPAEQGGAPVGGHDTNATTNNASTAASSEGSSEATNAGANSAPDPDAAP